MCNARLFRFFLQAFHIISFSYHVHMQILFYVVPLPEYNS